MGHQRTWSIHVVDQGQHGCGQWIRPPACMIWRHLYVEAVHEWSDDIYMWKQFMKTAMLQASHVRVMMMIMCAGCYRACWLLCVYVCSVLLPPSIRGLATVWTYFLHLSLLSWLTLPLSTSWCCSSSPFVVFLACLHSLLFLAKLPYLFLQPTALFPPVVTIVC